MAERKVSLQGVWRVKLGDGREYDMRIPGTLDESNVGNPEVLPEEDFQEEQWNTEDAEHIRPSSDYYHLMEIDFSEETKKITDRYTRRYDFEGSVKISRNIVFSETPGKRIFLDVERGRKLRLFIDEVEVEHYFAPTLVTPHVFEVTGLLDGTHTITLLSDNTYTDIPAESIIRSNMVSKYSQTNWNGLLGYVRLREEDETFIERLVIRPKGEELSCYVEISSIAGAEGVLRFSSLALDHSYEQRIQVKKQYAGFVIDGLKLKENVTRWEENQGNLYDFTVDFNGYQKQVCFGVRDFLGDEQGNLTLNQNRVFLRGTTEGSIFPETGYMPTDELFWDKALRAYKAYGVNFVRFASACPPDAAFRAADRLGILLQVEISSKGMVALEDENVQEYYKNELAQIIRCYGNHPSFVMLSMGDAPEYTEEGYQKAEELLSFVKRLDSTRLYSIGTNVTLKDGSIHGDSDFYMADAYQELPLRGAFPAKSEARGIEGFMNEAAPNECVNYDKTIEEIRKVYQKPIVAHEVGQYTTFPDFKEIDLFSGFIIPNNLIAQKEKAQQMNLLINWPQYVEHSGALSAFCYKRELEAGYRTEGLSGMVLKGLMDYSGEGAALVGLLNTHRVPKRFSEANPKEFSQYFRAAMPLLILDKYVYEYGEPLNLKGVFMNYGKEVLSGECTYKFKGEGILEKGSFGEVVAEPGKLTEIPRQRIFLPEGEGNQVREYELSVTMAKITNTYKIFLMPSLIPICPPEVYETEKIDQTALEILDAGGKVFLTPGENEESMKNSVKSQFSTDFWSAEKYRNQSGTMGVFLDKNHPLFKNFQITEPFDSLLYEFSSKRAISLFPGAESLIDILDGKIERRLSLLCEFRLGKGSVVFSAMGLKENMEHLEVRMLLAEIYGYMASYEFSPRDEIQFEDLEALGLLEMDEGV